MAAYVPVCALVFTIADWLKCDGQLVKSPVSNPGLFSKLSADTTCTELTAVLAPSTVVTVTVAVPTPTAVTVPLASTLATAG
ncbi:hypothetical protein D3C86_1890040 [compost metagenome]